ncbi:MAG: aldo/keto reductase [Bacteroidales bacterium]|nr:aldo/keto reductase [Bacteroidales bacterium]
MDRRSFLKGLAGAAMAGAAVAVGCDHPNAIKTEGYAAGEVPTGSMTYRKDTHGQEVSLLGFGMMRLPIEGGGSLREHPDAKLDQELINRMVDYAMEHGVNYYDTAPVYCRGMSEKATGIALNRHPRDKWLVATKMSNFRNWSREESIKMYEQSFVELGVDYIDYYLLHSFGGVDEDGTSNFDKRFVDNGILDFLLEEREKGRIRNLGWSFHGLQSEFDKVVALHDKYHWDFAQIQMNYVDWHYAHEIEPENVNAEHLYTELDKREIPIVIMEPVLGGRLATLNEQLANQLKASEPDRSLASWAFRHLGMFPRIMTSLSGMSAMEHVEDNVRTHSPMTPLSDEQMRLLEHVADEFAHYPAIPCTACQYCMPCPYGLDIPGIFAFYNKSLGEGNIATEGTVEQREYRRARKAFLTTYDKSIERMRQADHCINCGECLTHCPQSIQIPQKMRMIEDYTNKLKDSLV